MPAFPDYMSPFYKKIMSKEERINLIKMILETHFDVKQEHFNEKKFQRWLTPDDIVFVLEYIEEHFEEKVIELKDGLVKYFDNVDNSQIKSKYFDGDDNSHNQLYFIIKESLFCEGLPSVYNPQGLPE